MAIEAKKLVEFLDSILKKHDIKLFFELIA